MGEATKIEWSHHTFSAWIGCQAVSPACDGCYAEALVKRWGGDFSVRRRTSDDYWRQPYKWDKAAARDGIRRRVFCASPADVFDNKANPEWRRDLFHLVRATPHLDWLLLTKRPQNIRKMVTEAAEKARALLEHGLADWLEKWLAGDAPENVWLGTTVENQEEANRRIPHLIMVPARVHFLSCEPLLGGIDLRAIDMRAVMPGLPADYRYDCLRGGTWSKAWGFTNHSDMQGQNALINWAICGGESGAHARPMHPKWARDLRDECVESGTAHFFKQWGEWAPSTEEEARGNPRSGWRCLAGHPHVAIAAELYPENGAAFVARVGKKAAGSRLDGVEWKQLPLRPLLTPQEHQIIHNALGLLYKDKPYRSHYCAPVSGPSREACESLTKRGLLEAGRIQDITKSRFFHVTVAGAAALDHHLPAD